MILHYIIFIILNVIISYLYKDINISVTFSFSLPLCTLYWVFEKADSVTKLTSTNILFDLVTKLISKPSVGVFIDLISTYKLDLLKRDTHYYNLSIITSYKDNTYTNIKYKYIIKIEGFWEHTHLIINENNLTNKLNKGIIIFSNKRKPEFKDLVIYSRDLRTFIV